VFSFVDFTVSDIFLLLLSLCVFSACHSPEQPRSGLAGIAPLRFRLSYPYCGIALRNCRSYSSLSN
jgi:hypothetical protein